MRQVILDIEWFLAVLSGRPFMTLLHILTHSIWFESVWERILWRRGDLLYKIQRWTSTGKW